MRERAIAVHDGKKKISVSQGNGIIVETPSFSIALDPKSPSECDYSFVSHAHIDHVHAPLGHSKILASEETKALAKARGYDLGAVLSEGAHGIDLIDSGHIFGSRGVLIEEQVFYTGDIARRSRAFLEGCSGVKCDVLIMETTYGRPRYIFPDIQELANQVNRFISRCFDKCRPVVLKGYAVGKAQLLSYLFDAWDPIFVHESVDRMNSVHIDFGVKLKPFPVWKRSGDISKGPWVLIAPSGSSSSFMSSLIDRYDAIVADFTGWALDSRKRSPSSFPLSDHCDFQELVELAKYCSPSKIYTVHGFADEFARHLRSIGFDAEPLAGSENRLGLDAYTD